MLSKTTIIALVVTTACGGAQKPSAPAAMSSSARFEVVSEDIDIVVGERVLYATVTSPRAAGKYPAVVLYAGSGPTDRDWNNPLMPGSNGSGKLLAEHLSRHGAVVLRFDKQGSGQSALGKDLSWASMVADGLAAVDLLAEAAMVDPDRIFVAGHSEGALHALKMIRKAPGKIAGLLLLAAPGRPLREVLLAQRERQFRYLAGLDGAALEAEMKPLRDGLATFFAGASVDPVTTSKHVNLQRLVATLVAPETAALVRELYSFDPAEVISEVAAPILILYGGKDLQVSADLDGKLLHEPATLGSGDVTLHVAANADHVFKSEAMPLTELLKPEVFPQVAFRYNADDRVLDQEAAVTIVNWMVKRSKAK